MWVWLSPLLIVLGCMGLLWSFRFPLQELSAAAASAFRARNYGNRLRDIEMLGLLAVITIAGMLALAGFLKLAELTGLEALMHYIGRSLGR